MLARPLCIYGHSASWYGRAIPFTEIPVDRFLVLLAQQNPVENHGYSGGFKQASGRVSTEPGKNGLLRIAVEVVRIFTQVFPPGGVEGVRTVSGSGAGTGSGSGGDLIRKRICRKENEQSV